MIQHHYVPNRVLVLQSGERLCAVHADEVHQSAVAATNADVYSRTKDQRAKGENANPNGIKRELISENQTCDFCGTRNKF